MISWPGVSPTLPAFKFHFVALSVEQHRRDTAPAVSADTRGRVSLQIKLTILKGNHYHEKALVA